MLRVAIVGRPNVGKSALFNRLMGRRIAIVDAASGVTRDRLHGRVEWSGRAFELIDTGGLVVEPDELEAHIARQVQFALAEADLLLFAVDGIEGRTPLDDEVAGRLRTLNKPVWLVVGKADTGAMDSSWTDFALYGLPRHFVVSALHGRGIGTLLDALTETAAPETGKPEMPAAAIAIVGRPNAGKSSLINALLGQERTIVSDIPGTTRDAIDAKITWTIKTGKTEERVPLVFIDTAGIRRRKSVRSTLDVYSIKRAETAIRRASVAILLVDAGEGVSSTDKKIASTIAEEGTSCVIGINKWDLVEGRTDQRAFKQLVRQELPFLAYAPIVFVSAKTGTNMNELVATAYRVHKIADDEVTTGVLNRALHAAFETHPPPMKQGRRLTFYYATQVRRRPPRFTLFVNDPARVHGAYTNHMVNVIRAKFGFDGSPVQIDWKTAPGKERKEK